MNELTKDLGQKLLLLLWEVSTYPDPRDVSSRSRRDLAVRVVDSLCGSSYGSESDLREIVDAFVSEFAHSPYRDRAKRFGADLIELTTAGYAPRDFIAQGHLARRQHPKRTVPLKEAAQARRKAKCARERCLHDLARIQKEIGKMSSNQPSQSIAGKPGSG